MHTKFINIPEGQRNAMRTRARESLAHWKVNHAPDVKRFIQSSDIDGQFALYRLHRDTVYLYYEVKGGKPISTAFVYKDDELNYEVHLDAHKQHWTRKLFFDMVKEKQKVTAN